MYPKKKSVKVILGFTCGFILLIALLSTFLRGESASPSVYIKKIPGIDWQRLNTWGKSADNAVWQVRLNLGLVYSLPGNNEPLADLAPLDTDGDGMPDWWEVLNGLNPYFDDSQEDPDGDGLVNIAEYRYGTDPHNPDTDGDGMPDGWEVKYHLNPLVNDAAEDPDGDGRDNLTEYLNGTNPQIPAVAIQQPLPGARYNPSNSTIRVSGLVDYDVTEVTLNLSGTVTVDTDSHSFTGTVILNQPGNNTITAQASNGSGTLGQASVNVFLDVNPPTIAIVFPPNNTVINAASCIVRATASDNEDSAQDLRVVIGNFPGTYDAAAGNWWAPARLDPTSPVTTVQAYAMDRAGNKSDTVSITLVAGPKANPNNPPVTLEVTPTFGVVGTPVNATLDITASTTVNASSYVLDFGDGSTPVSGSFSGGKATVQHTYSCSKTQDITSYVIMTDSVGIQYFDTATFSVMAPYKVEELFSLPATPKEIAIDLPTKKLYVGMVGETMRAYQNLFGAPPLSVYNEVGCSGNSLGLFYLDSKNRKIYELTSDDRDSGDKIFTGIYVKDLLAGTCENLMLQYGISPPGSQAEPRGIYFDGARLYISFGGADSRVDVFNPLTYVFSIGKGEFNNPSDILWNQGKLNIVDSGNNLIRQYSMSLDGKSVTPSGQWTLPVPPFPTISGVTHLNLDSAGQELLISGGNGVLITDRTMQQVMPPLGEGYLSQAGGADSLEGEDCALAYFVADSASKKVYRYTYVEDELQIRQTWDDFLAALKGSNIELARGYIYPLTTMWFDEFAGKFGQHLAVLADHLPPGSELQMRKLCPQDAEFMFFTQVDITGTGPRTIGGVLQFTKDESGEWKIVKF